MRSALFWDLTKRRIVVSYRWYGTTYRSQLQGSSIPRKMSRLLRYASYLSALGTFFGLPVPWRWDWQVVLKHR